VNESEDIDEAAKGKILHENHDSILGGHRDILGDWTALLLAKYSYDGRNRRVCEKVSVE
jgi:hypothetical protein